MHRAGRPSRIDVLVSLKSERRVWDFLRVAVVVVTVIVVT